MNKDREMNYELIRVRLIAVYEEYSKPETKSAAITKMKEIAKEYEDVMELLDETLNCSIGIMDAISKGGIKDKKEEASLVSEIVKELNEKDYLGVGEEVKE